MKNAKDFDVRGKSVGRIISEHLFTLFNLINFVLAAAILAAGSYKNLLFIGVVFCNFAIGVFWEIKAKYTLEKLRLITQSKITVVRDGREIKITRHELEVGDSVVIGAGDGIVCDGHVTEGKAKLDESSLTGEADPVEKKAGDSILSGTVVLSGKAVMKAEKIGADCYAAGITRSVKNMPSPKSVMMRSLKKIIFIISIVIVPLGILMLLRQTEAVGSLREAVVTTAAALVGMIPDGLMLLTSTVLAIGVVKLARKKVLVQELYSIESLARTDVVCLDKTGTLTTGEMTVEELISWESDFESELEGFVSRSSDNGATLKALRSRLSVEKTVEPQGFVPFDSARKFSAVQTGDSWLIMGAAEFIGGLDEKKLSRYTQLTKRGRVLVLYRGQVDEKSEKITQTGTPLGMIFLTDKLREGARSALEFFYSQNVSVKIISGDNIETVKKIAADAGVKNAHLAVDVSLLSDSALEKAAEEKVVFARVTPERKKLLVEALRKAGHTVAMTGDGINDIQAMRCADCAIAPASGTDGAKNVASLVMLDDDFCSIPHVVAQGRQSIGNVERSSSVFLTKTVLSAVLTVVFLFWGAEYPFQPIQLTLISTTGIGITSFLLGLEASRDRIKGNFFKNIIRHAFPGGVAAALCVIMTVLAVEWGFILPGHQSSVCVLLSYICVWTVLLGVMQPLNPYRTLLAIGSPVLFFGAYIILKDFFMFSHPDFSELGAAAIILAVALAAFALIKTAINKLIK